jgi:hypothetical protein
MARTSGICREQTGDTVDLGQEEGANRDQWQEQAVSVGNKREIPWIWGKNEAPTETNGKKKRYL